MAFFISHVISTRDAHISLRAEDPRANMGRGLIWHVIWKMPCHNLFIIYFNASFFIFVRADRFQKPCSLIWDMIQKCHIISTFLVYVFRDIILIQLHFLYNNTRWFNHWFIKECHHSLHSEYFPCFLRNPLTVTDEGSKQRSINNENWSDRKTWISEEMFFSKKNKLIVIN
jgi:hypothetical protein